MGGGVHTTEFFKEARQYGTEVPEEGQIGFKALVEFSRVGVDPYDTGILAHGRGKAVADPIVHVYANQEDEVGVGQDAGPSTGGTDDTQEVSRRSGYDPPVPDGHKDRDRHLFRHALQGFLAVRVEDPAACYDHRVFCVGDPPGGFAEGVGITGALRGYPIGSFACKEDDRRVHLRL